MNTLKNKELNYSYPFPLDKNAHEKFNQLIIRQKNNNGWFIESNVREAIGNLASEMTEEKIWSWQSNYIFNERNPKNVLVIMAGNIPLVGFHDFMCALLSGHNVICKLSSDDNTLLPAIIDVLNEIEPALQNRIHILKNKIQEIDAVIATGSNNSLNYFNEYFGKYPHVFRNNRTSIAVLDSYETDEELQNLGDDIFTFFGLGCRNVTHLIIPDKYDLNAFFKNIVGYSDVINHHKYANNYDYYKAIFLLNKVPILDNNFVLLRESNDLFSSVAVINYHTYTNKLDVNSYLQKHEKDIQLIVGHDYMPFGNAQKPSLTDYADGIDTMQFLSKIS